MKASKHRENVLRGHAHRAAAHMALILLMTNARVNAVRESCCDAVVCNALSGAVPRHWVNAAQKDGLHNVIQGSVDQQSLNIDIAYSVEMGRTTRVMVMEMEMHGKNGGCRNVNQGQDLEDHCACGGTQLQHMYEASKLKRVGMSKIDRTFIAG